MLYQPGERPSFEPAPIINWRVVYHEWLKPFLITAVIIAVINLFFPRYEVLGHSMEPGLHERDRLFVSNLDVMTTDQLGRGQVVVLASPVDGTIVVKRIIGLPGETVEVRDGAVYVNGEALDEPYINEAPRYRGSWTLRGDQYFVLGDNRNHSYDSADYGAVTRAHIRGVVKLRLWPLDALGGFNAPQYQR